MANKKSNRIAALKAIGVPTGAAGVEAAKYIPVGLHPLELTGLAMENPEGFKEELIDLGMYTAADTAMLTGAAKGAEAASKTKKAQAIKNILKRKVTQALARTGTATAASGPFLGPFSSAVALGAGAYSIYDVVKELSKSGLTLEDVGQFIKDNTGPKMAKVSEKEAKRRKKAKAKRSEQIKERGGKEFKFKKTKKEILKSVGRKTGGKVGKPKGVGCAVKGYGKAMTHG